MSNGQKFPFNVALSQAMQRESENQQALTGRLWPCHVVAVQGQIVTVKFDLLPEMGVVIPDATIPIATFEYIRYPVQIGDKGVTLCAEVSIAAHVGLGKGLATRARMPSMAALYFLPLAQMGFSQVDPNKITLYGPDGAVLRTAGGESSITVDPTSIVQEAPTRIDLKAADIYLQGVIHLNGQIVQDPDQISGPTTASLIGPVDVQNNVDAADFSTPSVASQNAHQHDVENVMPGGSTRTSNAPKG